MAQAEPPWVSSSAKERRIKSLVNWRKCDPFGRRMACLWASANSEKLRPAAGAEAGAFARGKARPEI